MRRCISRCCRLYRVHLQCNTHDRTSGTRAQRHERRERKGRENLSMRNDTAKANNCPDRYRYREDLSRWREGDLVLFSSNIRIISNFRVCDSKFCMSLVNNNGILAILVMQCKLKTLSLRASMYEYVNSIINLFHRLSMRCTRYDRIIECTHVELATLHAQRRNASCAQGITINCQPIDRTSTYLNST